MIRGRAWLQPCHNASIRFRPRRARRHRSSQPPFLPGHCHLERSSFVAKRRSYAVERSLQRRRSKYSRREFRQVCGALGQRTSLPYHLSSEAAESAAKPRTPNEGSLHSNPRRQKCGVRVPVFRQCSADTLVRGPRHKSGPSMPPEDSPSFSFSYPAGAPPLSLRSLER